jgi:cyclopropane-fatty-acyl-phospholipid synthase
MPAWLCRLARRLVFSRLARLEAGKLMIVEGGESYVFGAMTEPGQLSATVTINDVRTYLNLALGGTVGGGEAYRRGYWSCDNLTALVRIFALNREVVEGMESGLAILTRPLLKVLHRLNRNSRDGSRRNIAAHYDLGNDFYRLMLDETMMYSCAYFERADATLAEASRAKIERICRKLELSPSDHLLEIGTGWGGFAIHAASQYGCRVTTATISRQQFDLATQRVREAGLSDRITVLLIDYRDLPKLQTRFDKLVSIEMIEAVGHEYYGTFFDICSRMLKPNGLMLMQGITIDERFYERAKRSVDFIQHFIFPGSCIPSISALVSASSRAGDLGLIHLEDIGCHYPRTLKEWRERFTGAIPDIRAMGYSWEFLRLWELYLCYCEGGFLERSISTVHLLFAKSRWRPAAV